MRSRTSSRNSTGFYNDWLGSPHAIGGNSNLLLVAKESETQRSPRFGTVIEFDRVVATAPRTVVHRLGLSLRDWR